MEKRIAKPHAAGTMNTGPTQHPTPVDTACNAAGCSHGDPLRRETRNTLVMEAYQITLRVGWIFKTETIIMPAVLDAVADSGLLRGLLPVLNRGGQSLPPLLVAGRLARLPVMKWTLIHTTLLMAVWFALLAVAWTPLQSWRPHLLACLFLVLYALFSASNGLNQLTVAALQGKLISPGHRGRAMLISVVVGSVVAVVSARLFLGPWLTESDGFPKIFGMTAGFFAAAAVIPLLFDEPVDAARSTRQPGVAGRGSHHTGPPVCEATWHATLLSDRSLVRLCLVAACFSAVLMLFPHYQAFARDRLGSQIHSLLTWVIAQNVATGVASLVAGPAADRWGTRIVLIWLVALSSLTPLIVVALSMVQPAAAVELFWLVYLPLGLNPISLKIFTNYALELAPRPVDHPRYVSIVGAALAAPFVVSPMVGMAVDRIGFRPVFFCGAAVIGAAAALATGLPEPRRRA